MKPITMAVRGLLRLALNACQDSTRFHLCGICFDPTRATVTDGYMLATVPLPADAHRGFVLPTGPLVEALVGADLSATVTLERATGSGETRVAVAGRAFVAAIADTEATIDRYPPIDLVLPRDGEPRGPDVSSFSIDAKLLVRVGELANDLGLWIPSGFKQPLDHSPVTIAHHGGPLDPVMFTFPAEHGTARVVVMPVRR